MDKLFKGPVTVFSNSGEGSGEPANKWKKEAKQHLSENYIFYGFICASADLVVKFWQITQ